MRYQYQRPAIFQQTLFQYFQRRNIQIVRGLIEQQHVGGLQHQLGNEHPCPLASRKPAHPLI